jgi:hypothetical protein
MTAFNGVPVRQRGGAGAGRGDDPHNVTYYQPRQGPPTPQAILDEANEGVEPWSYKYKTNSGYDPNVIAVRTHPVIGKDSLSHVDETMEDADIQRHAVEYGLKTPKDVVSSLLSDHRNQVEMHFEGALMSTDDPKRRAALIKERNYMMGNQYK